MADLIVNHVSSLSPQFQDYSRRGAASPYAGMFLTLNRVFPEGVTETDLLRIYRPCPGLPFAYTTLATGEKRLLWTTFTPQQVDIHVYTFTWQSLLGCHSGAIPLGRHPLHPAGCSRLCNQKSGNQLLHDPETDAFIAELTARARALGIEVLVEVHSYYKQQIEIARRVDWVYDFALPPLVLHALYEADAKPLVAWLAVRPNNAVTVLDTHDGIGVIDVGANGTGNLGLLEPASIHDLVEEIHKRSNGESRLARAAASNLDLYQVNCTYYDALGQNDIEYLIARAVQLFVPGIPQIYYVGLLAGTNDMELLARTSVGRDINRHYYTLDEVEAALKKPVVRRLIEIIRLRNAHAAFGGEASVKSTAPHALTITWKLGKDLDRVECGFCQAMRGDRVFLRDMEKQQHDSPRMKPAGTSRGRPTNARIGANGEPNTDQVADLYDVYDVRHDNGFCGRIIPEIIKTFHLTMTAAGAFHYANMSAIAVAAISLGFLADKLGRKTRLFLA